MADDDIESYWEDIRFYPPKPVDPIIQLRGEDLFRKEMAESVGLSFEDVRHLSFETLPQCLAPADGTCPRGCRQCVCANPDTQIATPSGARNISELHVGDLVYSVDHDQAVPVPIVAVKERPAMLNEFEEAFRARRSR